MWEKSLPEVEQWNQSLIVWQSLIQYVGSVSRKFCKLKICSNLLKAFFGSNPFFSGKSEAAVVFMRKRTCTLPSKHILPINRGSTRCDPVRCHLRPGVYMEWHPVCDPHCNGSVSFSFSAQKYKFLEWREFRYSHKQAWYHTFLHASRLAQTNCSHDDW